MIKTKLNIGITAGDPAGIGPEVVLRALADKKIQRLANFFIIGSYQALTGAAKGCKVANNRINTSTWFDFAHHKSLSTSPVEPPAFRPGSYSGVHCLDTGDIPGLSLGRPTRASALSAWESLQEALRLIKQKKIAALVTAPVNKQAINQALLQRAKGAGKKCLFSGHTEYLAAVSKTKNFTMMLIGGPLRVALVTRHIALKQVARALSTENIYTTIRLTVEALKQHFAVSRPRIAVCALNPHSGEAGLLGKEEREVIRPAISRARRLAQISGPLPADTLFYAAWRGKFDACVAMYHDQGLIPLKMLNLHRGVNITLGLPFVRTSPDHGTAYDIAGKNKANPGSMIEAIKLAVKISSRIENDK